MGDVLIYNFGKHNLKDLGVKVTQKYFNALKFKSANLIGLIKLIIRSETMTLCLESSQHQYQNHTTPSPLPLPLPSL